MLGKRRYFVVEAELNAPKLRFKAG